MASRYQHPDSGGSRDRYKPQYKRKSSSNDSYRGSGPGSSEGSYADRLVSRYHDSEDRESLYLPRTQRDASGKYDEIDSKIHARRSNVSDDSLSSWWKIRRERKALVVAASLLLLFLVVPRRRKMRIKFPGMPGLVRRRAETIVQEGHHIVQRAQYKEEERPRVHLGGKKEEKKKRRKSGFQKLHLRLPSDVRVVETDVDERSKEANSPKNHEVQIIPDNPDLLSPERDPNDSEAPPIFGMGHFKDTSEPFHKSDVPTFWHVPKSGGSTIKDVAGSCHRLITASNIGTLDGHENDETLQIVRPGGSMFVNINTHTVEGIQHAKDIGFPSSGMAEIIVSNFVHESDALGSTSHMLRFFGVFRHPIERAISEFYYIQTASWEETYHPELQNWTIEEYARSTMAEENWMTRQLANNPIDSLSDDDLALAKELLRRKFFVGLTDKMEESMDRFERFFRWSYRVNPHNQEKCREELLSKGGGANRNVNATKKAHLAKGTEGWELLAAKNNYDLQLYDYVVELFDQQESLLDVSHPKGYRRIKETCCKCYPPTYPADGYECPK